MTTIGDYSENGELFKQRQKLAELVDQLENKPELTPSERAALRRHRSALDMITYQLMQANHGLVRSYAQKFCGSSAELLNDYIAAGQIGLLQAIRTYNPDSGAKFGFWAHQLIKREVLPEVRRLEFETLSYADFEARPSVLKAQTEMEIAGEEVTPESIVKRTSVNRRQAERILNPVKITSIDAIGSSHGDEVSTLRPVDSIADDAEAVEDSVLRDLSSIDVRRVAQEVLDTREMYVITRRFGLDGEPEQTLSAIGAQLKLSRETVRNVQINAIAKLSHPSVLKRLTVREGREEALV